MSRLLHAPRRARDRGAAIVEFAIVVPLLLALLFGVVDYGLWFNDSLSVRQDTASSARTAAIQGKYGNSCDGSPLMVKVACGTKTAMSDSTGSDDVYAKVFVSGDVWRRGSEVVVCGMVAAKSFTGYVPLPAGGMIKSRSSMSIENASNPPASTDYQDPPPSGVNWGWCT